MTERAGSHRNIRVLARRSGCSRARFRQRNIFVIRTTSALCYIAVSRTNPEGRDVDLALKLNVLAVLAVFAFVGAILLGAL